jgi:predicted permease
MDRAGALVTKPAGIALGLHWAAVAVVALLIGLLPAWYAARVNLSEGLSQGAATHSSGRKHALARHALASLQIALSLVLLIAAALFAKSLHKLTSVPVGFDAKNLVVFSIDPKLAGSTVEGTAVLYSRVEQHLRGTPGVAAVTYGTGGPFPQEADVAVMIPGGLSGGKHQSGFRSVIGPDYFRTLGIPIIAGREFDARDRLNGPDTVVINEALAHKLFGTKDPVGQTVGMFNGLDPNWVATIVGVVRDYHVSWKRSNTSLIYTPAQQQRRISDMTFYVRTKPGASLSEQSIRTLVRSEAPALSAYDVETMSMRMEEFASGERAMSLLTASFAVLALIIAVIGIYGVVAYSASMRMTEFGIRMAMGAQPRQIISLVVREALLIFASGCAIAAPLLWLGLSGIRSQLYGTAPYQPPVFILAAGILGAFSLAAAFIPARRATRLNVQGALRHE